MTGQAFRSAASSRGDAPRSSELGAGYLANTSICFPARPHRLSLNPTLFLLSRARCRYQPAVAAKLLRAFGAMFAALPFATLIDKHTLVIHAGISADMVQWLRHHFGPSLTDFGALPFTRPWLSEPWGIFYSVPMLIGCCLWITIRWCARCTSSGLGDAGRRPAPAICLGPPRGKDDGEGAQGAATSTCVNTISHAVLSFVPP